MIQFFTAAPENHKDKLHLVELRNRITRKAVFNN